MVLIVKKMNLTTEAQRKKREHRGSIFSFFARAKNEESNFFALAKK